MKSVLFIGLVFALHHVYGVSLGCSSCHHGSYGSYVEEHHHKIGGCGFPFPLRKDCGKIEFPQSDWGNDKLERNCVPLVVRPHDIPKPTLNPAVAVDLTNIVANPSVIKKAIVKPAVLPKPVCKAQEHGYGFAGGFGVANGHVEHSCCGSIHGAGPCYGAGFCGVVGPHGPHGGNAGYGVQGVFGVPGAFGVPGRPGPNGPFRGGPLAPADVVSLDIANKLAREANLRNIQLEDKLHFGFRKLPAELPPKKIVQANVPEEGIFHVNGDIVEIKPIAPCGGNSAAALAEEAAEQLLALEEEEANAEGGVLGSELQPGIRRVSLSEIGYGLATPPKANLITVPDSAASVGNQEISTNCGCAHHGYGFASGHIGGCASCNHKPCECKIIPGKVEFETKPKPEAICLPAVELPDNCESAEIELSSECGSGVSCSCVPVCVHRHKCDCKKSCYTVEKLVA